MDQNRDGQRDSQQSRFQMDLLHCCATTKHKNYLQVTSALMELEICFTFSDSFDSAPSVERNSASWWIAESGEWVLQLKCVLAKKEQRNRSNEEIEGGFQSGFSSWHVNRHGEGVFDVLINGHTHGLPPTAIISLKHSMISTLPPPLLLDDENALLLLLP